MLSGLIAYDKTTYNLSVNFSVKNIFLSGSRIVSQEFILGPVVIFIYVKYLKMLLLS